MTPTENKQSEPPTNEVLAIRIAELRQELTFAWSHIKDNLDARISKLESSQSSASKPERDYQRFFTPDHIATRLVELASIQKHERVLEPSAGNGAIVRAIDGDVKVTAIEKDPQWHGVLTQCAEEVVIQDFLEYGDPRRFDVCVANPPFGNGTNIKAHLRKMWDLIADGGRLVTILPADCDVPFLHETFKIENWATNSDGSTTAIKIIRASKPEMAVQGDRLTAEERECLQCASERREQEGEPASLYETRVLIDALKRLSTQPSQEVPVDGLYQDERRIVEQFRHVSDIAIDGKPLIAIIDRLSPAPQSKGEEPHDWEIHEPVYVNKEGSMGGEVGWSAWVCSPVHKKSNKILFTVYGQSKAEALQNAKDEILKRCKSPPTPQDAVRE